MTTLRLFHGSNSSFEYVDFSRSRNRRDFGSGFYMTTIQEQAEQWAATIHKRYGGEGMFLYFFDLEITSEMKVKTFEGITSEWLELVKVSRLQGGLRHGFDVVRGPVANDDTMPTLTLFVDGLLSERATMEELAFAKANDQVSVHTQLALNHLTMVTKVRR